MTYQQVIKELQRIALSQRNVRSVGYGDLYRDLSADQGIKYDYFYITPNQSASVGEFDRFSLNLYHISRLENMDGDNILQQESVGKEVLDNIAQNFCDLYGCDIFGTTYYNFFIQKFADLTCGLYMQITFQVPKNVICAE